MMNAGKMLAIAAVLAAGCGGEPRSYEEEIAAWRADKDRYMQSADSPVEAPRRASFPPLAYFPIAPEYRVPAGLKIDTTDEIIEMSLSTGGRRKMRRVGHLEFTLRGQPMKLTAFADAAVRNVDQLFVPFGDLTNGTETYQGGRYLDLDRTATGIYDLDFNRAYHPFCVFNPEYICPVPPRENRLPLAIRAGEKLAPS